MAWNIRYPFRPSTRPYYHRPNFPTENYHQQMPFTRPYSDRPRSPTEIYHHQPPFTRPYSDRPRRPIENYHQQPPFIRPYFDRPRYPTENHHQQPPLIRPLAGRPIESYHQQPLHNKPHSSRPLLPTENYHRQPPYWKRPHTSNYRHPFWRDQLIEQRNESTSITTRDDISLVHDTQNKRQYKKNPVEDCKDLKNTESSESFTIESNENSKSIDIETYVRNHETIDIKTHVWNHEFDELLKPNQNIEPLITSQVEPNERSKSSEVEKHDVLNHESPDFFKQNQRIEPLRPLQIEYIEHSKSSEIEKHVLNHESAELLKLNSSKVTIDSKSKMLDDMSLSHPSKGNMMLPLDIKNTTFDDSIKIDCQPTIKHKRNVLIEERKVVSHDSESSVAEDSTLKLKNTTLPKTTFNHYKAKSISSREVLGTKLQESFMKPDAHTSKTSLSTKLLKLNNFLRHQDTGSKSSGGTKRTKLLESPSKDEETKLSKSLHSSCLSVCDDVIKFSGAKKIKSWDSKLKNIEDFYLKHNKAKKSKSKSLIGTKNLKYCAIPLKSSKAKSIKLNGTDNPNLANSSLKRDKKESKKVIDTVSSKRGNAFSKKTQLLKLLGCDKTEKMRDSRLKSIKAESNCTKKAASKNTIGTDSSLSPSENRPNKSSIIERESPSVSHKKPEEPKSSEYVNSNYCSKPYYHPLNNPETKLLKSREPLKVNIQQPSKTKEAHLKTLHSTKRSTYFQCSSELQNVMESRVNEGKRPNDHYLIPEENMPENSPHTKTLKVNETFSNSSDVKSNLLSVGKYANLESVKPKKTYSKSLGNNKKCIDAPLKYSEAMRMKSCYVCITKLDDSFRSKHSEFSKRHDFSSQSLYVSSTMSHDNYKDRENSFKPEEARSNKSFRDEGTEKSCYASSMLSENKTVKSQYTEKSRETSSKPKDQKLKMSLDPRTSKCYNTILKPLEGTPAKSHENKGENISDPTKPRTANYNKSPYDRITQRNTPLKRCGTGNERHEIQDPSFKKHPEDKLLKLRGTEMSETSDYSLKRKANEKENLLSYVDSKMSKMFGSSSNTTAANLNTTLQPSVPKHNVDKSITSKSKWLKLLEAKNTHISRAKMKPSNDQKIPINQRGESLKPHNPGKSATINESFAHGTKVLDPNLLSCDIKPSKVIKISTKLHEYAKSNASSVGSIEGDCLNYHTSESLLYKSAEKFKNIDGEIPTTDKNNQDHHKNNLNSSSSIKHPTSKATACQTDESFLKYLKEKCFRTCEANQTFESFNLAKAESTKRLGSKGIDPFEAGSFEQPPQPAMKLAVSKTKEFNSDETLPESIKSVEYNNTKRQSKSLYLVRNSQSDTLERGISTLREQKAMSTRNSEDCQSMTFSPEKYIWTSKLKICGVHLTRQPKSTGFHNDDTNPRAYDCVKSPYNTTLTADTSINIVYPSNVQSTQLINMSCSISPDSTSLKSTATKNKLPVFCKTVDPFRSDLVMNYLETDANDFSTSKPPRLPKECKKLLYSENNAYISEVHGSDIFPAFSSSICYSPVSPPKVGYLSATSRSPGSYACGFNLER